MNPPMSTSAPAAKGGSARHDLFALTDEQILEIEPEAQDAEVSSAQPSAQGTEASPVAPRQVGAGSASVTQDENRPDPDRGATQAPPKVESTQPPAWLAAQMKDPWTGGEAKELWNGVLQARKEAADYRAAFATPEDARALKELHPGGVNEARAVAERARVLDDIDRAYFGTAGNSAEQTRASRAQLAAMMLREDPAAFREMVFAGLRALEESGKGPGEKIVAQALRPEALSLADAAATADRRNLTPEAVSYRGEQSASSASRQPAGAALGSRAAEHDARLAAYVSFEKAANEDLERSVGATIERTLEQALPNAGRADAGPLKGRMAATIRQDVEAALKGDRQLGEQVAQVLSGRRLDNETRSQVVRLIGDRAQQLVPGAAKRVLNDWTQTTLAAHRGKTQRADAASARREVAPASPESRRGSSPGGPARPFVREPGPDSNRDANKSRTVDYRKLSDEQILEM